MQVSDHEARVTDALPQGCRVGRLLTSFCPRTGQGICLTGRPGQAPEPGQRRRLGVGGNTSSLRAQPFSSPVALRATMANRAASGHM